VTRYRLLKPLSRRRTLGLLGALGLVGCGDEGDSGSTTSTASGSSGSGASAGSTSCVLIPQETEGPYPLWQDIATASTYMRQDITEGRSGMPLNLMLNLVNVNNGCAPITNALVYVWHCDKDGLYSGYAQQGSSTVTSFAADGIFADGVQYQLATVSENAAIGGYDASLNVGVAL
jgi:protocatechuate 3,4-dioxygenase beta subunit